MSNQVSQRLSRLEERLSRTAAIDLRAEIQAAMDLILADGEAFALAEALADDPHDATKQKNLADRLALLDSTHRPAHTPKGPQ